MWFFFKRKEEKKEEYEEIKNSLSYFKNEFKKIAEWINHLDENKIQTKAKIDDLYSDLRNLKKRISSLERQETFSGEKEVVPPQPQIHLVSQGQLIKRNQKNKLWEALTEKQREICWKIAALSKEEDGDWISIKSLARELYPAKDYGKIRSTLSQYITVLEEMGYVERMRRGRETYVFSTTKNPYLSQEQLEITKRSK